MAANDSTPIYSGLVNDATAINNAIQGTTYDANQQFVVVPTGTNSCFIFHVVSA